jgi:hypothetical protein
LEKGNRIKNIELKRNRRKTEEEDRIENEERGLDEECGMQRRAG